MPLSHDVKIEHKRPIRFPDLCVVCGSEHPGDLLAFSRRRFALWQISIWFIPGRKVSVEIPACQDCRIKAVRMGRNRMLLTIAALCIVAGLMFFFFGNIRRRFGRLATMALLFAGISPLFLWEVLHPLPFDMTVFRDSTTYEFRNLHYAELFAELNRGEVT